MSSVDPAVAATIRLEEFLLFFFSTKRIGAQIHQAQRGGQRELTRVAPACAAPRP
jgi:hypothetical protein